MDMNLNVQVDGSFVIQIRVYSGGGWGEGREDGDFNCQLENWLRKKLPNTQRNKEHECQVKHYYLEK